MYQSPALLILDAAAAVIMLVLASLSKGLGEALKIPRYYRLLYAAAGLVLIASLSSTIFFDLSGFAHIRMTHLLPHGLRCIAGVIAVGVCMRYWKWLFGEYLKR
jgi:hypothetical protein